MKLKYTYRLVLEPDSGVLLSDAAEEAHQLSVLLRVPVLVRHNDELYESALTVTALRSERKSGA